MEGTQQKRTQNGVRNGRWEEAQKLWLAEFELLVNPKQEDALEARQRLGKDSRPFAGAVNL